MWIELNPCKVEIEVEVEIEIEVEAYILKSLNRNLIHLIIFFQKPIQSLVIILFDSPFLCNKTRKYPCSQSILYLIFKFFRDKISIK